MDRAAAALSLIAFGVTAFGAALPHFFGARSREIRWVTALSLGIAVWLAAQSFGFMTGSWGYASILLNALANLLAGLFLGFALLPDDGSPARRSWLAVGGGVAVLPIAMANHFELPYTRLTGAALLLWQVVAWGGAAFLLMRNSERRAASSAPTQRLLARGVTAGLASIIPVILIASFISTRVTYGYLFPLMMIGLQFLLMVGIAKLRFYDIEVRAHRAQELAAEASDAERMAVVGELASTLAHEIRNPLTGIQSLAQRLATEDLSDPKRRRYAEVIVGESNRVESLLAALLGVARRSPRDSSAVRLEELFADIRMLVEPRARKKKVSILVEANDSSIRATRDALSQVLLNVVINAIAQSPAEGRVRLSAIIRNGTMEVAIEDEGPGIDDVSKIWKPFYSRTGGTGLGLALVERTARAEGWEIRAENRGVGGARFVLSIPMEDR